jgi:LuxR family transcriptional regulator/LuxR family quorum-sensing system transcriptional regulator CciR
MSRTTELYNIADLKAVQKAPNRQVLASFFERQAQDIGFRKGIYAYSSPITNSRDARPKSVRITSFGYPASFVETYDRTLALEDPTPQVAREAAWPVMCRNAGDKSAHFFKEFGKDAFEHGWIFPLHGPRQFHGYLLGVFDSDNLHGITDRQISAMQIIAQWTHLRYSNFILPETTSHKQLSHRERQTLSLLARGLNNREIAIEMDISPATVDTFVRRVFEKVDVHDRVSAVLKGLQLGWI